jgi:hypothetical protein
MRKRSSLAGLMLLGPLFLLAAPRPGAAQVRRTAPAPLPASVAVRLPLFRAFTQGKEVYYTNFESSDAAFARMIGGAFAPRLAKARDDGTDEFFLVTNGASGQVPVLGSPPGDADYSPIWRLVRVTWKAGATKKLLTSEDDIDAQGENITEEETAIRFNCPVLLVSDDLTGTNLRAAPTLALGPQLLLWDVGRAARRGTALFRVEGAWHDGRLFAFLGLEGAPQGLKPNSPLLATVPKLSLDKIASTPSPAHDPVADFWVVDQQEAPVIDSVPEPEDEQIYSPLWHIHIVTFNTDRRPRTLHSGDEIKAATTAGDVTVITPGPNNAPDAVFNCPVIDARATTALPRAADEIRFLSRAGLLTAAQAGTLMTDLRRGTRYDEDVTALVTGATLKPEVGQLLMELVR